MHSRSTLILPQLTTSFPPRRKVYDVKWQFPCHPKAQKNHRTLRHLTSLFIRHSHKNDSRNAVLSHSFLRQSRSHYETTLWSAAHQSATYSQITIYDSPFTNHDSRFTILISSCRLFQTSAPSSTISAASLPACFPSV